MTNSESPSPKKEENNKSDYSFSGASEDEVDEFNNVEVNAALLDLKATSKMAPECSSSLVDDENNIGKKLMDRKRLRIFASITKKDKAISS